MILFTSIIEIVSGVSMLIWSFNHETFNVFVLNEVKVSTTFFNKILAGYVIVNGISTLTLIYSYSIKLFSSIASIHSFFEIFILALLHQGGCVTSNHALASSIIYLLISEGATLLLPIPYSFTWFKFQGLTIDFALFIQFLRIYLTTKKIARNGYSSLPQHASDENEPEEHNQPNHKCHFYVVLLTFDKGCILIMVSSLKAI
ncbi:22373_t:CDS:2 [Cetraspora pellucida]|uniref:22373_t:CDS:1 n=1 Tax=Cetraspora pellucida TaxID=1433469 RepID=A0A9N8VRC8_9GLOM|nr:22373_t:CDS:2 [Cetraspora pellucida]